MKRLNKKYTLVFPLFFLVFLLITLFVSDSLAQVNIEPNLDPGKVYNLGTLPKTWFDFVFPSRAIWGKNATICWFSYGPESSLPSSGVVESEEYLIYVIKGPVTIQTNKGEKVLHDTDCVLFKKGDRCQVSTGPDSAELIEINWPVMPWIVSMKFFSDKTPTSTAIPPSTIPTLPPDSTICLRKIEKVTLGKNILGRLIQGERGQLCNFTLLADAVVPSVRSGGEEFLFVMRGSLEKDMNGETVQMNEGDVMYLPEGTVHGTKVGQYGCEILSLVTPVTGDYIDKYEQASKKIRNIVPLVEPDVVVDGMKLDPIMSGNAEGPSWVNGKLYFSDQQAGVYVVNSDGSCKLITHDIRTCGTSPLPNGNLAVCDLTNKRVLEITLDGEIVKVLADSTNGLPKGNPNDLATDSKGGLYVTVNDFTGTLNKTNAIVYINPEGKLIRLTDYNDIFFPNGIALSADGSRLFVSSHEKVLWMFDVKDDGSISNKRPFAHFIPSDSQIGRANTMSMTDGIEIDALGNIYVATAMVGGIQVFGKTGKYIGTIKIPSTNLVFGGEDLKTLYVTASGKVFSLKMNVPGMQYSVR